MNFMQIATRIIKVGVLAVALLAITAACASHGDSAGDSGSAVSAVADTGTEAVAKAEDPSERLICRRIKPTGSRVSERVCMWQAQWEKYAGHSRRELKRLQRGTHVGNPQ